MSNSPNLARTVAIEVRFSLNFAVIFDFTYFRFRPVKQNELALSDQIGKMLQVFFLLYNAHCILAQRVCPHS